MDAFGFLFYRGIERWMIVVGGLIFGYLGYKLFLYGVDKGHGKLQAENQFFKLTFSGSGPGLFFMAFGALILVSSVYSTGTVTRETLPGDPAQASASSSNGAQTRPSAEKTTLHYADKSGAVACNHIRLKLHDGNLRDALEAYRKAADPQINAMGTIMERLEDEDLKVLLPAIEAVICE